MLKGLIYCLLANFLFGVIYYFAILLRPLSGESMFGFRIVVLAPFVLLAILLFKQQDEMRKLLQKLSKSHRLFLLFYF